MAKYYHIIAGFPILSVDDRKLPMTQADFNEEIRSKLTHSDLNQLDLLRLQDHHSDVLAFAKNPEIADTDCEEEVPEEGLISIRELKSVYLAIKEKKNLPKVKTLKPYIIKFLLDLFSEKNEEEDLDPEVIPPSFNFLEDKLATYYYDWAIDHAHGLLKDWFVLNLTIKNIFARHTCEKLSWDPSGYIVGTDRIAEAIRTSKQPDFGLSEEFPCISDILRIANDEDITQRERMLDVLKWQWLEDECFFHPFDFDRLLAFYLEIGIIERWTSLNVKTGEATFRKLVGNLKSESTKSLDEFRRNQKKK